MDTIGPRPRYLPWLLLLHIAMYNECGKFSSDEEKTARDLGGGKVIKIYTLYELVLKKFLSHGDCL